MSHEKQTSPTIRTVAEVQQLSNSSVENMRGQLESQTGATMRIKKEVLVYEPWDKEAAATVDTMIGGLLKANPAYKGMGIMGGGVLDIEGSEDKQPFTAFVSTAEVPPHQVDMACKTVVDQCNQMLGAVESPLRLPDF